MLKKALLRWLFLFCGLTAFIAVLVFMLENQQSVIISFAGWSSVELAVSSCVILALLVGMVIGPILGFALKQQQCFRNKKKRS